MKTIAKILPLLCLLAISCKKYTVPEKEIATAQSTGDLVAPDEFNYETTKKVAVNIQVNDLTNKPLVFKNVAIYSQDPSEGGVLLGNGFTDLQGVLKTWVRVPTYINDVYLQLGFVGFANNKTVAITNNTIATQFGGANTVMRKGNNAAAARLKSGNTKTQIGSSNLFYIGTFDASTGVPDYLENPGDAVSTQLLNEINSALPNTGGDGPNIAENYSPDATIIEPAEVWVTFISEGAGFKNSLGYYVYETGNPPSSANDIDSIFVIFPNASLLNSGGGLQAGDKVCLGVFPAGVSIGWVLFQNAWKDGVFRTNLTKIYSEKDFNPESDPTIRAHNVQLLDNPREIFVVGFEDQLRDNPSCDNDFNDCIFYYTSTPFSALDKTGSYVLVDCDDSDGDGVDDCIDQYPNDPSRVADSDYQGTLSYEDLWPHKGDYDFNDMVIEYDLTQTLNASNQVVSVAGTFTLKAIGAGFNNGFGLQLDNVSEGAISSSAITQDGDVTGDQEAGNAFATFILFQNAKEHMVPTSAFVNTVEGAPYVAPKTFDVSITFSTPQDLANIGFPPYNPFIYVNKQNEAVSRGREVHLPDLGPTNHADVALFGYGDDDTDLGIGKYYKTATNLPWGLHIEGGTFDYPKETVDITNAYLNFVSWAQSGGALNPDWYLDISGNRVNANIYPQP